MKCILRGGGGVHSTYYELAWLGCVWSLKKRCVHDIFLTVSWKNDYHFLINVSKPLIAKPNQMQYYNNSMTISGHCCCGCCSTWYKERAKAKGKKGVFVQLTMMPLCPPPSRIVMIIMMSNSIRMSKTWERYFRLLLKLKHTTLYTNAWVTHMIWPMAPSHLGCLPVLLHFETVETKTQQKRFVVETTPIFLIYQSCTWNSIVYLPMYKH